MATEKEIADFAEFAKIPSERARKILESKDGRFIRAIADGIVPELVEYIDSKIRPLQESILELELRPSLEYCGVHDPGRQYNFGECVTSGGSMFQANRVTRAKPGTNSDWTLCCKRGKDGKDAR